MWGLQGFAVALATLFAVVPTGQPPLAQARSAVTPLDSGRSSSQPQLSIAVSGNHFINQNGQTVRLLGVDHPGTEYACQEGWGYTENAYDPDAAADQAAAVADAAAIASWNADAVRVPLNEDCWLGINNSGFFGTQAGYRQYIQDWVSDLNADGLYAILDLHWSAPGSTVASDQWPMADQHSVDFWSSVASTFKDNHAVLFDAFNEPYSPATDYGGDAHAKKLDWGCWENGGCTLNNIGDNEGAPGSATPTYTAVGMQQIVTAIRNAGASQPILLGGLDYSNDLTGWLAHEPTDPDNQLAASFHTYEDGGSCDEVSCYDDQVAPVVETVPVVITEFDENQCPASGGDDFDQSLMNWADGEGVGYLAWGWDTGPVVTCSETDYFLTDGAGNPAGVNGTLLQAHLATVSAISGAISGSTTGSGTTTQTTASSGDSSSSPKSGSGSTGASGSGSSGSSGSVNSSGSPGAKQQDAACVVPNLRGESLVRARRGLRQAHCGVGRVVYRTLRSSSAASGRRGRANAVISEIPAAGRRQRRGTRVELVVARSAHAPA